MNTSSKHLVGSLGLVLLLTGACTPPAPPSDSGTPDSSGMETGTPDGGDHDAGDQDSATMTDSGSEGGTGAADWGFRAMANGFSFENYGAGQTDLTPDDMRRIFGPMACEGANATGACVLTPPASQWMQKENAGLANGHCEGFTVLSMLFFANRIPLSMFGSNPANTFALQLPGNTDLQREIAVWAVSQSTVPNNEDRTMNPNAVVTELENAFRNGNPRMYVLGIYKREYKDGHAMTPYAVEDMGNGMKAIKVYDNNYPGQERTVTVNTTANTWQYFASINPSVPASMYEGDGTSNTLTLARTDIRLTFPHPCGFCGDATATGMRGSATVNLTGKSNLRISNAANQTIGYNAQGQLVNTMTGAGFRLRKSPDLWSNSPEPLYDVPRDQALTITLDGTSLAAAEREQVFVSGPGYGLSVEDINVDPGQVDTINLEPGAADFTYHASGSESPDLVLAFSQAGADYELYLKTTGTQMGQNVRMALDMTNQKVMFTFAGSAGMTTYALEVHRVDNNGVVVFGHSGNAAAPASKLYLNFGAWGGNGMPMSLETDMTGDGTVDSTTPLSDDL